MLLLFRILMIAIIVYVAFEASTTFHGVVVKIEKISRRA